MYVKLFASLYQGTLRGKPDEILVFTNMLAHADQHGMVDMHFRAIAEEVGITIERVKAAVINLEMPDQESRSHEEEGKRLIRLDEHREWGWRVVNYIKYRAIRNEDDRREQNRAAQEKFRNKSKPPSAEVILGKPVSAHTEAEAEAEAEAVSRSKTTLCDFPKNKKIATDLTVDFETAWGKYPERAGGNSKSKALKAWLARIAEGVSPEVLISGVDRYANFILSTDKLNTEFVKQAATFFGPDKHYLEAWRPPAKILKPNFEGHHSTPSHKEFPR